MKEYIRNKRKIEFVHSLLSILFWVLNFSFIELSINMFFKIITVGTSRWFDVALEKQLTSDPEILNKTDMMMDLLMVILVIIIIFAIVSIVFFRNIQLKNMLEQMGIYRVLGYNKKQLLDVCMIEPIADMAIAFPISLAVSIIVWNILSKMKMIGIMMQMMNNNIILDFSAYIISVGVMVIVTVIHTKIFMEKALKKGIRYMLGKGVV